VKQGEMQELWSDINEMVRDWFNRNVNRLTDEIVNGVQEKMQEEGKE